jgi:hypothetical protein
VLGELCFDALERSGHDPVGPSRGFPEKADKRPLVGRERREEAVGPELTEGATDEALLDADFSRDSKDFPLVEPLRARALGPLLELELDGSPDHPVEVAPRYLG